MKEPIMNNQTESQPDNQIGTLSEPIKTTIKRDFSKILSKITLVLIPKESNYNSQTIKDWDLWGPLIISILLSLLIGYNKDQDTGLLFIIIFFIIWIGGFIITLNAQFLGSNINLFQSICLIGYCISPFLICGFIIKVMYFLHIFIHISISIIGFIWACLSSNAYMSLIVDPSKKILACYPIFLLYGFMSWIILT